MSDYRHFDPSKRRDELAPIKNDSPNAVRSLGKRDLSRLPIKNMEAYKDWCEDINDTWTDS